MNVPTLVAGDPSPVRPRGAGRFSLATEVLARARAKPGGGWLWHGYLARGHITLLTSFWKSGKTTLVSVLVSKMAAGGMVGGQATQAGRVVVVTGEAEGLWAERIERLSIGTHARVECHPFREQPTPEQWDELIDDLLAAREEEGLDLAVFDSLVHFVPGRSENDAIAMTRMLRGARRLANAGVCVLILHHPRREPSAPGRSARGSGAIAAEVDIILEMDQLGRATDDDRRRRLWAFSRHRESPRRQVIELSQDGSEYAGLGDFATSEFDDGWPVLYGVLEDANKKLTRRQVRDNWPADFEKPAEVTLWRWLDRAVADGRVLRNGSGRSRDPFVYWLDGMEEVWKSDPFYMPPVEFEPLRMGEKRKTLSEVLAERANGQRSPDEPPRPRRSRRRKPAPAEPDARSEGAEATAPAASLPEPAAAEPLRPEPATAATPADQLIFVVLIRVDPEADDWMPLAEKTADQLDIDERDLDGTGLWWNRERSARTSETRAVLTFVPRDKTDAWSRLQVLVALARKMPWVVGSQVMKWDGRIP